jgi:hypothetical protein
VISCNNEGRDAAIQHATHAHDTKHGDCCSAPDSSCRDLHLLNWVTEDRLFVEDVVEWLGSRDKPVLIIGFDGVTNSAACAIAFLMAKHRMRFNDAYEAVRLCLVLGGMVHDSA